MRQQKGTLRVEARKSGETWVYRFHVTRPSDGKRVENTKVIGLLADFPTVKTARAEVERLSLHINDPDFSTKVTFQALADLYVETELKPDSRMAKAHTTRDDYNRVLTKYLNPRWGTKNALKIEPLQIQDWFDSLYNDEGLANPSIAKIRKVFKLVYDNAIRLKKLPLKADSNPVTCVKQSCDSDYEAITFTPEKAFEILGYMRQPEKTLTLLVAATGLRPSEALGLMWSDVDYENEKIYIRRGYINGQVGKTKTKASRAAVAMHPILAGFMQEWQTLTPWCKPEDWIFASERLDGERPRRSNMIVADHLKPAAIKAKIPELLADEKARFGFSNFRHSLATTLTSEDIDPKTVQAMLRHANVKTTLNLYAKPKMAKMQKAQGSMLVRLVPQSTPKTEVVQ